MEFYTVEKIDNWYFRIKLPYVDRGKCSYKDKELTYIYAIGRYVNKEVVKYLYQEEVDDGVFVFQIGYAAFILNTFYNQLSSDSIKLLEDIIFTDNQLPKFDNLLGYQNEDLHQLFEYRRGLFQTFTSYGKTEVISTLANYIVNQLHQNLLIVTGGNPALNEISNRLYDKFGIDLDYFDEEAPLNLINVNGFLRSSYYDKNSDYWKKPMWILADEVEYCVTEGAMEMYENIPNIIGMYGFSATSDKKAAEPIYSRVSDSFMHSKEMTRLLSNPFNKEANAMKWNELLDKENWRVRSIMGRNKYLVGYFGTTVVFKKPEDFNITLIDVTTTISADDIEIPAEYSYNEIIYNIFVEKRMCNLIESIVMKEGLTFIPMFRLEVIDYWIDNYFKKDDFLVLCICGRGYELYENGEYLGSIDLEEMKRLVHFGRIGVILGTRSSYNALDLPELNRCILLYSKVANIVIQAIGRTTRSKTFEVFNISPMKNIPQYSKDYVERKNLIKEYYKECNIVEVKRLESYYGC